VADRLAALQGCDRAVLSPSTLHLFWDLFGTLAAEAVAIYLDSGCHPVSRWGAERAAGLGVPVRTFEHYDAEALHRKLEEDAFRQLRPLVVAAGFCPGCGKPAPSAALRAMARSFGGQLILDDTQALGILGDSPRPGEPYGRGGGGSLRWSNMERSNVVLVSSLAKGFGVPVAALAGSSALVRWFEARSETRVHCSPPSVAVLRAAEHALAVNETRGDTLRQDLAARVQQFRDGLERVGLSASGDLFPAQTLAPVPGLDAQRLHRRLLQLGVQTVLHGSPDARISFLVTAAHTTQEINSAVDALIRSRR
jgi:8-amino-7-oxononanoate synthase